MITIAVVMVIECQTAVLLCLFSTSATCPIVEPYFGLNWHHLHLAANTGSNALLHASAMHQAAVHQAASAMYCVNACGQRPGWAHLCSIKLNPFTTVVLVARMTPAAFHLGPSYWCGVVHLQCSRPLWFIVTHTIVVCYW